MRNFYHGAFLGATFLTSYSPSLPQNSSYDKVTFYGGDSKKGGCIIDKVYGFNGVLTEDYINTNSNIEFKPQWLPDTYLLAEFDNSYAGGNVSNIVSPITNWMIYRSEVGSNVLTKLDTIDVMEEKYIDYTALKNKEYIYYLFAKNDTEISSPLTSSSVECDYNGWHLIDVEDKVSYLFDINFSGGDISQVEDINEYNTNKQFMAYSRGATNYIEGSIRALVMDNLCDMKQGVDYVEQLRRFIYSDKPKYLKDNKGRIFKVFTSGYSDSYITQGIKDEPRYISFNFKEIGNVF